MVRLQDLVQSRVTHPVLVKAADTIASVMVRRSGTVGGNICLDTRCYWFNQTEQWRESIDWCHKCDCGTEADCRVIPNQIHSMCGNLPSRSRTGTNVSGSNNTSRRAKWDPFYGPLRIFQLDGMTRNVLQTGELVTHLTLPEDVSEWQGDYQKLRQRESWDFPEAGVAALLEENGTTKPTDSRWQQLDWNLFQCFIQNRLTECLEGWTGTESINDLSNLSERL